MDQKFGEFVGVDKLYTFNVIQDDESGYVADTPEPLAPVAEIAGEAKTDNNTTYYDNKAGNNYVSEAATELKITVSNVPGQKIADITGKDYDAAAGRIYDSGEPNPPDKGLMCRYSMGKSGYRYYCYLKGTFSGGSEDATSKGEKVDAKTYDLTYTGLNTVYEWNVNGKLKSLKRVYGDTADLAFDPTGWFDQAQTPSTTTPPSTLTVSSVPADNATSVAVGANVVLTFNNKISTYNIVMVKSDWTAVTTLNSFDAAGKVLTINPSADLSAASAYAVILTDIKDIYGQSLANQVINFTTA